MDMDHFILNNRIDLVVILEGTGLKDFFLMLSFIFSLSLFLVLVNKPKWWLISMDVILSIFTWYLSVIFLSFAIISSFFLVVV